jgi:predicted nucleic acid-binding protein
MIVLDTSAVLALFDADDADHARCVGALPGSGPLFVVPAGILGELGCLIEAKLGATALRAFVGELDRRAFALDCGEDDFAAIGALLERFDRPRRSDRARATWLRSDTRTHHDAKMPIWQRCAPR